MSSFLGTNRIISPPGEPLGAHWGNFAESRVLKQTWLRDGPDGRDGTENRRRDLYGGKVYVSMGPIMSVTICYVQQLMNSKQDQQRVQEVYA